MIDGPRNYEPKTGGEFRPEHAEQAAAYAAMSASYAYDTAAEAQMWLVTVVKDNGHANTTGPWSATQAADMAMHINDPKLAVFIVEVVK